MGFLSEIKKLLFAQKSVAKSAANKSGEFVKDKADDLVEASKDFANKTGSSISEKTSGLRDAVMEKSKDAMSKGKELLEDVAEKGKELYDDIAETEVAKKAAEFTEGVGEKVISASGEVMEKAMDVSESVGKKVIETTKDISDKGKDLSESLGEKILAAKDHLSEKAQDIKEDLSETIDETIEKAERLEAEEAMNPKEEFSDETLSTGDSLLGGSDDFFEKAARFADGDYEAIREGTTTIIEAEEVVEKEPAIAAGFEDADGDGNEIIDDAVIVYSDEEE